LPAVSLVACAFVTSNVLFVAFDVSDVAAGVTTGLVVAVFLLVAPAFCAVCCGDKGRVGSSADADVDADAGVLPELADKGSVGFGLVGNGLVRMGAVGSGMVEALL